MRILLAFLLLAPSAFAQDTAETRLFSFMTRAYAVEFASLREGILEAELLNACNRNEAANARIDGLFVEELRLKKALLEKVSDLDLGGMPDPEDRRARAGLRGAQNGVFFHPEHADCATNGPSWRPERRGICNLQTAPRKRAFYGV